jgi:hypothetical protein
MARMTLRKLEDFLDVEKEHAASHNRHRAHMYVLS